MKKKSAIGKAVICMTDIGTYIFIPQSGSSIKDDMIAFIRNIGDTPEAIFGEADGDELLGHLSKVMTMKRGPHQGETLLKALALLDS